VVVVDGNNRLIDAPEQRWLRVAQAASYFNMSVSSLWTLIRKGEIQHVKIGRRFLVDREEINAYLEKRLTVRLFAHNCFFDLVDSSQALLQP
jgi:excisionase family DNA binding protein